jgi:hypothetical protein
MVLPSCLETSGARTAIVLLKVPYHISHIYLRVARGTCGDQWLDFLHHKYLPHSSLKILPARGVQEQVAA